MAGFVAALAGGTITASARAQSRVARDAAPSPPDSAQLSADSALFRTVLGEAVANAGLVPGPGGTALLRRAVALYASNGEPAGILPGVAALRARNDTANADRIARDAMCTLIEYRRLKDARRIVDGLGSDELSVWERVRFALQLADPPRARGATRPGWLDDTSRAARRQRLHDAYTRITAVAPAVPRFSGLWVLSGHALDLHDTATARNAVREAAHLLPHLGERREDRTSLLTIQAARIGDLGLSQRLAGGLHTPGELVVVAGALLHSPDGRDGAFPQAPAPASVARRRLAHKVVREAIRRAGALDPEDRELAMLALRAALFGVRDTALADSLIPPLLYPQRPRIEPFEIRFRDTLRAFVYRHDYAGVRRLMAEVAWAPPVARAALWAEQANTLGTQAKDTAVAYALLARRILAESPESAPTGGRARDAGRQEARDRVLSSIARSLSAHGMIDSALAAVGDMEDAESIVWAVGALDHTRVDSTTVRTYAARVHNPDVRDALLAHLIRAWLLPKATAGTFAPLVALADSIERKDLSRHVQVDIVRAAVGRRDTAAVERLYTHAVAEQLQDPGADDWALSLWVRTHDLTHAIEWARNQPTPRTRARALTAAAAMLGGKIRSATRGQLWIDNGPDSCRETL